MASKARKPAKSTEHTQRKRALQRTAKVQKPAKPIERAQRSEQELVVDEAKRVPINYLEDGVVEWGIKRE